MNKQFTQKTIAQWKRIAANVNADVISRDKIIVKITELNEKLQELNTRIELQEAPVKLVTNGFTTSDILQKVVEETGKFDKEGRPLKSTKYVLKYPETILPPTPDAGEIEPSTCEGTVNDTPQELNGTTIA